ncbi:hypothetical protein TNCV_2057031 [Trichonephila clavipes]|nr:hypothetical protein TNCV_2057031 [Trichonephila clavipes]
MPEIVSGTASTKCPARDYLGRDPLRTCFAEIDSQVELWGNFFVRLPIRPEHLLMNLSTHGVTKTELGTKGLDPHLLLRH